ncbi:MAG TPA: MG2 domain-containing protein [Thermoanaerobaculia bacterium]|nr:MG2 domain-containing protein [Thermoanaerobaculia bacterium]
MRLRFPAMLLGGLLLATRLFADEGRLQVTQSGPEGEIASLTEANEIRVTFSEPMVTLGKIPSPVKAPFLHIAPALAGTYRWSGTKTLIFTPDPRKPLPFATKFTVSIDETAVSINGHRLLKPFSFTFSTPSVKLLSTSWYRKNGKADQPVVIALRFNQPVDPQSAASHLQFRLLKHDWTAPVIPEPARSRMPSVDQAAFDARVARTRAAAAAESPVFGFLPDDWDKKRFPPAPDLVVFETRPGVPTDSWIQVLVDGQVAGKQGTERRGARQNYTVRLEPTFFVTGFQCTEKCDPEAYNPIVLTTRAEITEIRKAISVKDITDSKNEIALRQNTPKKKATEPEEDAEGFEEGRSISLEDAGYSPQPPATKYAATLSSSLQSSDGQQLGYNWSGVVGNWHKSAFTSFGDGHGVWESSGGNQLPFYARNLKNVTQWAARIEPDDLMPTIEKLQNIDFRSAPEGNGVQRKLTPVPDKIQSFGIDMSSILSQGHGLVWAALKNGEAIPQALRYGGNETKATVVQVTNLGITVKDSPQSTLVFVTTLDKGEPVSGATVAIRNRSNALLWTGTTDSHGLALAPALPLRDADEPWSFPFIQFIVTAEKDGDIAYVGSDWNEGIRPWDFGLSFDLNEAKPLLRGTVFADRGVYKLGEELHIKAILRTDTPTGIRLLPADSPLEIVLKDSRDQEVDHRTVKLGPWSSAEWTLRLPADGALGTYTMTATVAGQRNTVESNFLVAAYRRPDFRVDATLTGDSLIAGANLNATVTGRYLFGATMSGRTVGWTYSKEPFYSAPRAVLERYPDDRYVFASRDREEPLEHGTISSKEAKLDAKGELHLALDTKRDARFPYQYTIEGDVTDISRQKIAGRAATVVHPAPWYIGLKRPPYFADSSTGLDTEVVAVAIDGQPAAGLPVTVTLRRVQWIGVRRAEGNGFYTWETERKEVPAGTWTVTSTEKPAPLHIPIAEGGYYILKALAADGERSSETETSFYALGSGYTAWERYDHNRIDLVPERKTYRPGDTARIMIQSPWESATALITTEREGVRSQRQIQLTSTQQTISVPITAEDIPNLFVSVVLIKGRTKMTIDEDGSDPGKPAFRIGYTELKVDDTTKNLTVEVKADHEEFRPAKNARVSLTVKDSAGKPVQSEVTLGGRLRSSLTHELPDTADHRERVCRQGAAGCK